jgi:hypothetical protein
MATVTASDKPWSRTETQERVRHPLSRLRKSIRIYVTLEALGLLCLAVALWFWISLILDYGFFQLTGVDWVQVLPWGARAIVLAVLVTGLTVVLTSKMLLRLFREFRDGALALVLERRYPAELGDRLITAVELADPTLGDRYGYSQTMIEHTIQEAADRVGRLPVIDVFNWRRLQRLGIRVAVLTIGVYLVGGAGYCLVRKRPVGDFIARFNNVAIIWFERNILLADTIWPRKAYLELVDFPASGELKVGRDSPPPTLRVRAVKWVIADRKAPEGWRALLWKDLHHQLVGESIPRDLVPPSWREWTVDQVESEASKPEVIANLGERAGQISEFLARLELRVDSPKMERSIRKLIVPDRVVIYYRGDTTRSEQTLKKQADNEYSGPLSDLRESVRFTANGEDYYTPYKKIKVVPPPSLIELTRDEEQPAYIYHRPPPGAKPSFLRGKKQQFKDSPVSLSGSASRIEVPAGTNVILKGKTEKELQRVGGVQIRPREGSASVVPHVRLTGPTSFEVLFENVMSTLDFTVELTDTDNVTGLRPVVIKPTDDAPPDVDVQVEYVRRTNQGYMVTPLAEIPFGGKVRDDHGLEKVEYAYELASLDAQAPLGIGAAVSAFQSMPQGAGADFLSFVSLASLRPLFRLVAEGPAKPSRLVPVYDFVRRLRATEEDVPAIDWEKRLREKPANGLLKDFSFDPDERESHFNVEPLALRVTDERVAQPRYRMRLWVVATDNNVETGPGVSASKEKFTFLIVSENELLLEIAREEEGLHVKLEDTINKLKEGRNKLDLIAQDLPTLKPEEFSPMARRAEEIAETVTKGWDVTSEISKDYLRIVKELKINRVNPKFIDKIEKNISDPLQEVINPDREFDHADKSLRSLQKMLEEKKLNAQATAQPKQDLEQLIIRLARVLDNMGDVITINKLIEQLVQIEKGERGAYERFKELNDEIQDKILNEALNPPDKKP